MTSSFLGSCWAKKLSPKKLFFQELIFLLGTVFMAFSNQNREIGGFSAKAHC